MDYLGHTTLTRWSRTWWRLASSSKAPYTLSVKLSDLTVWPHTRWKNWVNFAVLTGNSAGLRTVFSSRLSHTELRSSLRESHSFLSLPADTTMASSQGTSVSTNSFSRWTSHDYSPESDKGAVHSQSNWAILLYNVIPDGKTD